MSRYTDHDIPTTLTSRLIYRIYFIWMKSRTNKPIHSTASKTDKTRQAMNIPSNNKARSRNHFCRGKAISETYYEPLFVFLH